MRQLTLLVTALLATSVGCTQVKVTNSVTSYDAILGSDAAADGDAAGDATDVGTEISVADVPAEVETTPLDSAVADTTDDTVTCVPACDDLQCGDDGCGGSCGDCAVGEVCTEGACCAPQCENKACGDDGCGGVCGTCSDTDTCEDGVCVSGQTCEPDCVDKYCGDDGCSGSCGECVSLADLEDTDKDEALRELYSQGLALGLESFLVELGSQLAQASLPGAVSLAQPPTSGVGLDESAGGLSCPLAAFGSAPEPEGPDCDQWVNESSGAVYADVVASLANPANMPAEVAQSGYGKDAEEVFLNGVKTGNEWGRARARWDLAASESPVCDGDLAPVIASKIKGVIVGAKHFGAVLNQISNSDSFAFSGEYPAVPEDLALCSFSESLLDVAREQAKAFALDDLPVPGPCGAGYNPPPQLAEIYEQASQAFETGVSIGIDAEYFVASVAFFEDAVCGTGP